MRPPGGTGASYRGQFFLGMSFGFCWGCFLGFLCVDIGKSAGVTRMGLVPKLQSFFLFFFVCGNFEASPYHS